MATINMTFACLPPIIYLLSGTVVPGISLGTAVVLATMQARLAGPIQQLLALSGTLQSSRAMFDRVFCYLDLARPQDEAQQAGQVPAGTPRLVLRNVCYQYPGSERPVVHRVDLDFPPRSFTVVVGPSGSGKSTLALLAAGLVRPSAGEVRIEYPQHPNRAGPRAAVTLVPQEVVLFNTSIRENLLFARPQADDAELSGALAMASLDGPLRRLPDGLATSVGERGYQLSGGERQRFALARALLSGKPVLIVDEATSALDGLTAAEIYQQLRQISRLRTVVMIAHRLPPLAAGDRVVVIDDGSVVEQGCHGDLLSQRGVYHKLVTTQSIIVQD
jgi:ATP-binding cassette subfamily B protein